MALSAAEKKQAQAKAQAAKQLRKKLLIATVAIAAVVGLAFLINSMMTLPEPDLKDSTPEEVVEYFGHPRGFARMPYEKRHEFLARTVESFQTPEEYREFHRAVRRMTSREREVFGDACFETARRTFMEKAREYNNTSPSDRKRFVDNAIREWDSWKERVSAPPGSEDIGELFQDELPQGPQAMTKFVFSKTSPKDRDEAEDFYSAIKDRADDLRRTR